MYKTVVLGCHADICWTENEEDQLEVELQAALNKVRRAKAKASAKRDGINADYVCISLASHKFIVASLVLSAPKKVKTEGEMILFCLVLSCSNLLLFVLWHRLLIILKDEEPNQDDKSIVFSQMSEFVRNVGSEDRKADMTKKARAAPQVKQVSKLSFVTSFHLFRFFALAIQDRSRLQCCTPFTVILISTLVLILVIIYNL